MKNKKEKIISGWINVEKLNSCGLSRPVMKNNIISISEKKNDLLEMTGGMIREGLIKRCEIKIFF
jgi:hypothetical protein